MTLTSQVIFIFSMALPIAIVAQFARSQGSVKANLIEATALALAMSLSMESGAFFPHLPSWISFTLVFAIAYYPGCFFADWIRKRSRHDA